MGRENDIFERELVGLYPWLRNLAMGYVHNRDKAQDLVQDTIERALRNRESFTLGTSLKAWTSIIMKHRVYSDHRRSKTRENYVKSFDAAVVERPAQEPREILRDTLRAMDELSPEKREVLELVVIEGATYDELAERFNIPIGTVKSRVWRARAQLSHAA